MIPYANMAPYEALGPPEGCYFVQSTPRNSIAALQNRAVWAAAVPVGGMAALTDTVAPIGRYGIAAHRQVMSVMLFSDRPFDDFSVPQTVQLTDESATSVRLLYLLLGQTHGYDRIPQTARPGETANGTLVIGDTALKWYHEWETHKQVKGYRYVTDLATQWDHLYGLPFVFARWVVRSDAPRQVTQALHQWLVDFQKKEFDLIQRCAANTAHRLDLPVDFVHRYLKIIRRCLTPEDEAGQQRFIEKWTQFERPERFDWFDAVAVRT